MLRFQPKPTSAKLKKAADVVEAHSTVTATSTGRADISVHFVGPRTKWACSALLKRLLDPVLPKGEFDMKLAPLVTAEVLGNGEAGDVLAVARLRRLGLQIFQHNGSMVLNGVHSDAAFMQGELQRDVLAWLQADEFFDTSAKDLAAMELQSWAPPQLSANKTWTRRPVAQQDGVQAKKLQISGSLSPDTSSTRRLNGLELRPFVLLRTTAWRVAFLRKNTEQFDALNQALYRRMYRLGTGTASARHVALTSADELFISAGQAFITQSDGWRKADESEVLSEDPHTDGAAGMLHLGLTYRGHRALKAWTSNSEGAFAFEQRRGSFYMSDTAAFKHQAVHRGISSASDVFQLGRLKHLSCSVMMRSTFFPAQRARLANRFPSPESVFNACSDSIKNWFLEHGNTLLLPSLTNIKAEHVAMLAATRSSVRAKRPRGF